MVFSFFFVFCCFFLIVFFCCCFFVFCFIFYVVFCCCFFHIEPSVLRDANSRGDTPRVLTELNNWAKPLGTHKIFNDFEIVCTYSSNFCSIQYASRAPYKSDSSSSQKRSLQHEGRKSFQSSTKPRMRHFRYEGDGKGVLSLKS